MTNSIFKTFITEEFLIIKRAVCSDIARLNAIIKDSELGLNLFYSKEEKQAFVKKATQMLREKYNLYVFHVSNSLFAELNFCDISKDISLTLEYYKMQSYSEIKKEIGLIEYSAKKDTLKVNWENKTGFESGVKYILGVEETPKYEVVKQFENGNTIIKFETAGIAEQIATYCEKCLAELKTQHVFW